MTKPQALPYLPTMFATCMLFQVLYVGCVALWTLYPDLKGHALLADIFPAFTLLTPVSFIYGFIASAFYGWAVAVVFIFFFNLWPSFARILLARGTVTP
jgi:hypothetical protein